MRGSSSPRHSLYAQCASPFRERGLEFPRPFSPHTVTAASRRRLRNGLRPVFPRKRRPAEGLALSGPASTGGCPAHASVVSASSSNTTRTLPRSSASTCSMMYSFQTNDNLRNIVCQRLARAIRVKTTSRGWSRRENSFGRKFDPPRGGRRPAMIDQGTLGRAAG
jgi:hypothetical protein